MLPRLSPPGVQQFIDSVTFSESAVDNMTIENRMEIANRALRFARQQDAAQKKKGISETQEERCFKLHTLFPLPFSPISRLVSSDSCLFVLFLLQNFMHC